VPVGAHALIHRTVHARARGFVYLPIASAHHAAAPLGGRDLQRPGRAAIPTHL